MSENESIVVLVTAASAEKAAALGRALVEERLAACANVIGPIRSIYRWEGKVHDEPEALLVIKTLRASFAGLRDRVLALHEYSCPEVIALPIVEGHGDYLRWIGASVGGPA